MDSGLHGAVHILAFAPILLFMLPLALVAIPIVILALLGGAGAGPRRP